MNLELGSCSYNAIKKAAFQRSGVTLLRQVKKLLIEMKVFTPDEEVRIRYNAGGIAVSGDCTLHSANIYVSFNLDICDWVLVRRCAGLTDYSGRGGPNRQFPFSRLGTEGAFGLADFIRKVLGEAVPA